MASLDLEAYKDFVLKLKIKAAGGTTQIRRLRLPRVADNNGNVSYEELVGLVVNFTFPSADTPGNFTCTLTYFDEDEDTITIASTAELVDAVEQFTDKRVLRISTEVQPRSPPASIPSPQGAPEHEKLTREPAAENAKRADRGTSTDGQDPVHPQIQNVLDSFVGVLATAVTALDKGLAAPQSKAVDTATVASASNSSATKAPSKDQPKVIGTCKQRSQGSSVAHPVTTFVHQRHTCDACFKTPIVGKRYHSLNKKDYDLCQNCFQNYSGNETQFVEHPGAKIIERSTKVQKPALKSPPPFVHEHHTCDNCFTKPIVGNRYIAANRLNYDLCESCYQNYTGEETQFVVHPSKRTVSKPTESTPALTESERPEVTQEAVAPASAPTPSQNERTEGSLPFIHGRHTCDSCLTTPIVGKRFHATNIKDFDLCEKCHQKHKGTEIQFESVELPRDRAFQKRWNWRRRRIADVKAKNGKGGRARNGLRNRRRCSDVEPAASSEVQQQDQSHSRVVPIETSAPVPAESENFDVDLKEAIRRSLQDVMPAEPPTPAESVVSLPAFSPSAPTEAELAVAVKSMVIAEGNMTTEEQPKNTAEPIASFENVFAALDHTIGAQTIPGLAVLDQVIQDAAHSDVMDSFVQDAADSVNEKLFLQSMEDNMSVDSEKMLQDVESADTCLDTKPAAVVTHSTVPCTPDRNDISAEREPSDVSPNTVGDDSFALDAVGNGDVAEAMGATLDIVAGVISEMLSEADSSMKTSEGLDDNATPKNSEKAQNDSVIKSGVDDMEKGNPAAAEESEGHLILNSDEHVESTAEGEDGWEVVQDDIEEDHDIANATQMLGSALFNSEMRSSDENVSTLTNSDCFSAVTSVPSTVPSIHVASYVSQAQRNRWATQLEKLRELGFDDETVCIETLERLHAANIGCDEDEEISVTQVVNVILETE